MQYCEYAPCYFFTFTYFLANVEGSLIGWSRPDVRPVRLKGLSPMLQNFLQS
jgi:hypothetical protein